MYIYVYIALFPPFFKNKSDPEMFVDTLKMTRYWLPKQKIHTYIFMHIHHLYIYKYMCVCIYSTFFLGVLGKQSGSEMSVDTLKITWYWLWLPKQSIHIYKCMHIHHLYIYIFMYIYIYICVCAFTALFFLVF